MENGTLPVEEAEKWRKVGASLANKTCPEATADQTNGMPYGNYTAFTPKNRTSMEACEAFRWGP